MNGCVYSDSYSTVKQLAVPQQANSTDCGVYTLMFAEAATRYLEQQQRRREQSFQGPAVAAAAVTIGAEPDNKGTRSDAEWRRPGGEEGEDGLDGLRRALWSLGTGGEAGEGAPEAAARVAAAVGGGNRGGREHATAAEQYRRDLLAQAIALSAEAAASR